MQPHDIVRLDPTAFLSEVSCLGEQLVTLLRLIRALRPDLKWYVADVQTVGPFPVNRREAAPTLIGDTGTLMEVAQRVNQFESGVFAGVPSSIDQPAFRAGGLWTEDEEAADLGDAVVEVRAFRHVILVTRDRGRQSRWDHPQATCWGVCSKRP